MATQTPYDKGDYYDSHPDMTVVDKQAIEKAQADWEAANKAGDEAAKAAAHDRAEAIRATYGYSGGGDGTEYIPLEQEKPKQQVVTSSGGGGGISGSAPQVESASQVLSKLTDALDSWRAVSEKQQVAQIDRATQTGVEAYTRAQEDAQAQYAANQAQIAAEGLNAMDNSGLYAEMRGDKGGIGQAQYNAIQNTMAINAQTVKSEQTKMSTDVSRAIADLRAQGEYDKADALLQVSQSYLSQLIQIEQYAANYGLDVAQFEESIREWENEFVEKVREYDQNFALNEAQVTGYYNGQPTQETASTAATALLGAGIIPSDEQLRSIGMTKDQAQEYVLAQQVAAAAKKGSGGGGETPTYDSNFSTYIASAKSPTAEGYAEWLRTNTKLSAENIKAAKEDFNKMYGEYSAAEERENYSMVMANSFLSTYGIGTTRGMMNTPGALKKWFDTMSASASHPEYKNVDFDTFEASLEYLVSGG